MRDIWLVGNKYSYDFSLKNFQCPYKSSIFKKKKAEKFNEGYIVACIYFYKTKVISGSQCNPEFASRHYQIEARV